MEMESSGDRKLMARPRATRKSPSRLVWLAGGLLLACLSCTAQAGMYKWIDDQGRVHYTQTPPPKGSSQARINTDTFSSVKTHKAQPVSMPKRARRSTTKRTKTVRRRSCSRR